MLNSIGLVLVFQTDHTKRAIRISNGTEQIPYKGIVNKIGLYRKNNEIMRENMGDIYKTMNKMEEVIRND